MILWRSRIRLLYYRSWNWNDPQSQAYLRRRMRKLRDNQSPVQEWEIYPLKA